MLKFITILYKNEDEISKLFSSIKSSFDEFELIISLNSSLNNQIFDEKITYIGDEINVGFGNAVNRALHLISAEDTVCIVNSDVKFKYVDFIKLNKLLEKKFLIGPVCYNKNNERQIFGEI